MLSEERLRQAAHHAAQALENSLPPPSQCQYEVSPEFRRNMEKLCRVPGVMIMPPMLTFYNGPSTLQDMVHHMACKALASFGIECSGYKRWE